MLYLAPLQGFTDFVYRMAYSTVFEGVDAFFIPYISVKSGQILKKYIKEILPENNPQTRVIPQVLAKNGDEMLYMSAFLEDYGYKEINLNLGCPYPMVTNRGKGSSLLAHPEKVEEILTAFFEKTDLKLSVKLRAGLNSANEIEQIIPVLNKFPFTEIIVHPRIAKQLYKGEISDSAYQFAQENSKHRIVYNGDIFSVTDYQNRQTLFPKTKDWMLGRGILINPFLPSEINGKHYSEKQKQEKLLEFYNVVFEGYSRVMDNPGNVLNKMKQFWIYFSYNFTDQRKTFKKIKKARNIAKYQVEVQKIFSFQMK